jgi:hypothetical protein
VRRRVHAGPVELKGAYEVVELARLVGFSRWQMYRYLRSNNVPVDRSGGRHRVWLSRLKTGAPDAYESLLDVEAIRSRYR